jgi:hypothetical protein
MVYRFKLVSDEVSNFARQIEIDSEATFLDLRKAILDSVGFHDTEIDSFFICNDGWEREQEVTLIDMGSASDQDIYVMGDTRLEELIEDEGQRLVFVFDYLTDRSFFMELKEVEPGVSLDAPQCTVSKGNPPAQTVNLDEFDSAIDAAAAKATASADSDIFGDEYGDGYDDEDLAGLNDDTEF